MRLREIELFYLLTKFFHFLLFYLYSSYYCYFCKCFKFLYQVNPEIFEYFNIILSHVWKIIHFIDLFFNLLNNLVIIAIVVYHMKNLIFDKRILKEIIGWWPILRIKIYHWFYKVINWVSINGRNSNKLCRVAFWKSETANVIET